ncbi:MAG TPA: response regulator, partial [Burkholderiaceae bacterium]|nr:response regulator [Burkholderiaceae bacterium]
MNDPKVDDEGTSILLVDDQPARLLTYEAILQGLGHRLVSARSGTEALQRLMEREFAAILLDVNMPDMDGFETASMIHQHPRFERTPIIFVTGVHVTDIDRLKGYEVGAVDYVYVPVVPEILRGKVRVLVELYIKRRELQRANASLERANAELANANAMLQAENTRELQRLNAELEARNIALAAANQSLADEVAERGRIQDRLVEADRRKDEFLAMLAHELRNPLSAIHNAAQLIQAHQLKHPQIEWAQGVLQRQLKHLTRLIDDLLDVSRIATGKIKLRRERLDLRVCLQRALETSSALIQARRHALRVNVPEQPLWIDGDSVRLAQIIDNLLTNAAKYTDEGGTINVTLDAYEGQARLKVCDTGIGIPPALLAQVFDLFIQAEPSLDRSQGGLGIGLALAKALVSLHGGEIEAASGGLGCGSVFEVRLPLATITEITHSIETRHTAPADDGFALRLLIVDDNVDSAEGMAVYLRMRGHEVRVAYSGPAGLNAALEYQPDAILLDIGLPGFDGYEVARQLRAQTEFDDVPLIAMTGYGRDSDRERAVDAGFTHHLVKPVDYDVLAQTLAVHANAKTARQ